MTVQYRDWQTAVLSMHNGKYQIVLIILRGVKTLHFKSTPPPILVNTSFLKIPDPIPLLSRQSFQVTLNIIAVSHLAHRAQRYHNATVT